MFSTAFRNTLLYSTWLVLGALEIALGGERLAMTWLGGASAFGYVVGATLIGGGVMLLRVAHKVVKLQTAALVRSVRVLTALLVVLVFGIPLLHVLIHSLTMVVGKAEANPAFYRSLITLAMIFIGYPVAAGWANRRLKRPALSPNGHGPEAYEGRGRV